MTSPSYPAALDALANPGPTTETDDAGFELDIVVARLQNCIMAIEGKLGIGTGGPPASAAVLRRTATGSSAWAPVAPGDLATNAAGQVWSKASAAAFSTTTTGWGYDSSGLQQAFTLAKPALVIAIVEGSFYIDAAAPQAVRYAIFSTNAGTQLPWTLQAYTAINTAQVMTVVGSESLPAGTYTYTLAVQCGAAGFNCKFWPDGSRTMTIIAIY